MCCFSLLVDFDCLNNGSLHPFGFWGKNHSIRTQMQNDTSASTYNWGDFFGKENPEDTSGASLFFA